MKRIWLVRDASRCILGVFTSETKARNYVEIQKQNTKNTPANESLDVTSWIVQ